MKDIMTHAAKSAGEIIMKYYNSAIDIESKGEKGIITKADKEAEEKILSILLEEFHYGVIAEESGETKSDSEYYWAIDPIDGTTNFSRKIPFFCVSIALFKKNQPEAAVIYQPLTDELFYAQKNKGAFLNNIKLACHAFRKPVLIDCNKGYGKESGKKYLKALESIFVSHTSTRLLGSSALELAYLADGRVDCFITYGDELYDVAAGILIAQEAGCSVSNWKGDPWNYKDVDLVVAPPSLHRELVGNLCNQRDD